MLKITTFFLIGISILILGWFLSLVFSGQLILPQTFNLGPLIVHYYGIVIALAVMGAYMLARYRAPRFGFTSVDLDRVALWVVAFGFIGARVYHVITDYQLYMDSPISALYVWNGGLAIYGAVIGGFIGLYSALGSSYRFGVALAWLTPSILVGQVIGRFGNFFNYELFGYPTALPWKMFVPEAFRSLAFRDISFFHPLFLYESLGNFLILILLLALERRQVFHKVHASALFISYILLYNALRFLLEFLRIDSVLWAGIRFNAYVSLALALLSLVAIFYLYVRKNSQYN